MTDPTRAPGDYAVMRKYGGRRRGGFRLPPWIVFLTLAFVVAAMVAAYQVKDTRADTSWPSAILQEWKSWGESVKSWGASVLGSDESGVSAPEGYAPPDEYEQYREDMRCYREWVRSWSSGEPMSKECFERMEQGE